MRTARPTAFFLSGAAALIYQVVWMRLLARVCGGDALGIGIVLAVFMGGMGLGSALGAEPVRRSTRPRRLYFGVQLFLAAWAATSPFLLGHLDPVASQLGRTCIAALVLLPPTVAMGVGFPLMGRLSLEPGSAPGTTVASFYGINTLGAACGALLGAFALMPLVGLTGALFAGAALDALAGFLMRPKGPEERAVEHSDVPTSHPQQGEARDTARWYTSVFLLGFAGLALEVVLTRMLISVTGASVFAFALVLVAFLAGLGGGARLGVTRLAPDQCRTVFRACAAWLAPLTLGGLTALAWQLGEPDLFGSLRNRMPAGAAIEKLWAFHALIAVLAMVPPALVLGLALPAAAGAMLKSGGCSERVLGRLYASNTLGATVGSLGVALVLLPVLGPHWTLGIALVAGTLPALLIGGPARALAPVVGAIALGLWLFGREARPDATEVLFHGVGRNVTVAVEEVPAPSGAVRALRIQGKVVATSAPVDMRLQRLLSHIPGLLHGEVESALVIGLGTGMTAGALLDFPSLRQLDVFELSGVVLEAARRFEDTNGGVVDHSLSRIRVVDGRHALWLSEQRYDLITADPIHPWTRGSSDLYSLEHFERIASHLAPGGIASQWLPLYQLSTEDVRTVIATWLAVFPHATAWITAYDLALVGSLEPHAGSTPPSNSPSPTWRDTAFAPAVAEHLAEVGIHSPIELAALQVADTAALAAFAAKTRPMTEDRPRLEFRAPLAYLSGYSEQALAWAARSDFVPELQLADTTRALEVRGALEQFLAEQADPAIGLGRAADSYGKRLLELPPQ